MRTLLRLGLVFAALVPELAIAGGSRHQKPPPIKGACRWVRGRFIVANGSSIQRIWLIGTHRVVAMPDDTHRLPKVLSDYESAYAWRDKPGVDSALYARFRICALEDSRPGEMQHVSVEAVRSGFVSGKPFPR